MDSDTGNCCIINLAFAEEQARAFDKYQRNYFQITMSKGTVYLWTGIGAGKTTSSIGVALRQVAHKQKVIIIQFMKGRKDVGEYIIRNRLKPYYEIYQFGTKKWINLKNPSEEDRALAHEGLAFAFECLKKKPSLIILDEINLAVAVGLLTSNQVIKFLDSAPAKTSVYLTGRYASKKLIDRADYATEFVTIKQKKIKARKGIEY
jgi:cob(I)alamin adenosyltransferase